MSSAFGSGPSNGQFWFGGSTFPGFLYKKNVGVGGRRSTKMTPGGNITCNSPVYLYNKYTPGASGVGASSMSNRRAKNRHATVCRSGDGSNTKNCFPCQPTLGQYSNYTHNPNGYYPCITLPAPIYIPIPPLCPEKIITIPNGTIFTSNIELEVLRGCTTIIGDLLINNFIEQPDFSIFDCLSTVEGYFDISSNSNLTNIIGFNALKTVRDLYIGNNDLLETISGFKSLKTSIESFNVSSNIALNSILGFNALKTLGDGFNITNNTALISIPEFNALEIVGNDFNIFGNINLITISGLNSLISISGNLNFNNNTALITISGFNSLETIGGILIIVINSLLTSIPNFIHLTSISNNLFIYDNPLLTSIPGFNNLATIGGSFIILNNTGLLLVTGFNALTTIIQNFNISDNISLTSISGFNVLTTIGSNFNISGNTFLTSISGFSSVPPVGSTNTLNIDQTSAIICKTTNDKLIAYFLNGTQTITVASINNSC